jgi:predicted nucleic acid-binding protein
MIVYAETSAVLRWLFNEDAGDQILTDLQTAEKVVCSRLTLIETRRVIRRALMESRLTEAEADSLLAAFGQATARWAILEVSAEVAQRAEGRFPVEPVRSLDAIHLASAMILRESLPGLFIISTDERIRSNAHRLGLDVLPR